jgi:hypothetical protein
MFFGLTCSRLSSASLNDRRRLSQAENGRRGCERPTCALIPQGFSGETARTRRCHICSLDRKTAAWRR